MCNDDIRNYNSKIIEFSDLGYLTVLYTSTARLALYDCASVDFSATSFMLTDRQYESESASLDSLENFSF